MPAGNLRTERKTGNLLKSPFTFKKYGQSGIEVSEIFPKLGECADDLCVIRSMYTDRPESRAVAVHAELRREAAGPAVAGFVAHLRAGHGEPESAGLRRAVSRVCRWSGHQLWSSTFLPAVYQGTYINTEEKDTDKLIQNIRNNESDARAAARRARPAGQR